MITFFEFIKISYKKNYVYKINAYLGIINILVQICISCQIWKALFDGSLSVDGISYNAVQTNFIISLGISCILTFDDFFIQERIKDGSIGCEFIKPIDLRIRILAENMGEIIFKILFNYFPALLIVLCFIQIEKPHNLHCTLFFLISIILGVGILWLISLLVQLSAFWIINVWSVSTIKNVIINLFAGAVVPIWFMPENIKSIIISTPLASIYYVPMQIYLDRVSLEEIRELILNQCVWIVILIMLTDIVWTCGKRKVVMQGG